MKNHVRASYIHKTNFCIEYFYSPHQLVHCDTSGETGRKAKQLDNDTWKSTLWKEHAQ